MIARSIMISIASATALFAQNSESSSVCWSARSLPICKGWIVTEIGLETAFSSTSGQPRNSYFTATPDFGRRVVLTLGGMKNTESDVATGFVVSVGSNEPDQYYRAELRRRHWLAPDQSIEYSGGVTTMSIQGVGRRAPRANGITGGLSFGLGPIGLDTRLDVLYGKGRPVVGASAGVKAGGKSMPFATLGLGLYFLHALATMS